MKLSPPKVLTFWLALVVAALGLLGQLGVLAFATPYAFWLVFAGFVLLFLGVLVKGL